MFNGIIFNQGKIKKIIFTKKGINLFLKSNLKLSKNDLGISVCCDGVCLTLISIKKDILEFYLSKETINRSKFNKVKINDIINMHTSEISFLDCRTTTVVVQSTQKDLLKLMPKDAKEDLSKKLISPMPGLIKSVDVIEGQKVKNADQLLIIEAMKMENILKSEKDCVIEKILVKAGDSVSADEELILFKN